MKTYKEKGIALPLVMIAIMIGAIIIPSFLGRVSAGLEGTRHYSGALDAQYAADSGAEHAIWNLTNNSLNSTIPNAGDSTSYALAQTVNDLNTGVKVSNTWEVIAQDNFNSGDWSGGAGWLGDWSYSGEALVTGSDTPYEGAGHLRLRSNTGVASRSVDLSQQVSVHLYFWAKAVSFDPSDTALCRISHDGANWTTVCTWTQAESDGTYHYYDIDLTPYGLTAATSISFIAGMTGTGNYFYVDDLKVVWPAAAVTLKAADDFENSGWSGGSGWLADWTQNGSSSVTNAGIPHSGGYHMLLQDFDANAARAVDLSGYSVARLRFWAKVNEFELGDKAYCRVSNNGLDWQTVYTWTNANTDNTYHYFDFDLTSYGLADAFWITFNSGMNAPDDYFYVDDISIEAMRAYTMTVTAGGRILKAAVDVANGQEKVLCWWFIT